MGRNLGDFWLSAVNPVTQMETLNKICTSLKKTPHSCTIKCLLDKKLFKLIKIKTEWYEDIKKCQKRFNVPKICYMLRYNIKFTEGLLKRSPCFVSKSCTKLLLPTPCSPTSKTLFPPDANKSSRILLRTYEQIT